MFMMFHEDSKGFWDGRSRQRFHFAQAVMNCKRAGERDRARVYLRAIWALDRGKVS